ncbi:hypothetical protein DPMN_004274 [Dreissena polymorpha]|uniref:Uncharacterized protein n=1 Tax=Dreissena polymorpha TaxID=45954 RepID=A0A9D4MQI7_DREPO|nr:hypothetical protein DPMN_004274 [Dreissena polymorpha]
MQFKGKQLQCPNCKTGLRSKGSYHNQKLEKMTPPPGGNKTHVLTKFHEDWTENVTSRMFTCFQNKHIEKTVPPPGGHVFSPIWTIFELVRDINETNVLTKFHDDWAKIVTSRVNTALPPGGHLDEDWASNVASTVFISFELSRGINRTNVLTKFHEDRTIIVASGLFTRQMLTTDDGQKAITKAHHEHAVLRCAKNWLAQRNFGTALALYKIYIANVVLNCIQE